MCLKGLGFMRNVDGWVHVCLRRACVCGHGLIVSLCVCIGGSECVYSVCMVVVVSIKLGVLLCMMG